VLARAVDLASVEGLDGLTIGRLADELRMSKSGLFRLFGSKQELQLATVDAATRIFTQAVIEPASGEAPGVPRLRAIVDGWLAYVAGHVFEGGCFFYAAAPEVDRRPGPVRDALARATGQGLALLRAEVVDAQDAGEIDAGADPDQVVFELHALVQEANLWHLLHDDTRALARARAGVDRLLADLDPHNRR